MENLELKLISPDKEYYNGPANMVVIPGEEGDFSAMKDHAPIVTYLRPGKLEIFNNEADNISFFVGSGFVKVLDNRCLILVDYIKEIAEIDKKILDKEIEDIENKIEKEKDKTLLKKLILKKKILQEQHLIGIS